MWPVDRLRPAGPRLRALPASGSWSRYSNSSWKTHSTNRGECTPQLMRGARTRHRRSQKVLSPDVSAQICGLYTIELGFHRPTAASYWPCPFLLRRHLIVSRVIATNSPASGRRRLLPCSAARASGSAHQQPWDCLVLYSAGFAHSGCFAATTLLGGSKNGV